MEYSRRKYWIYQTYLVSTTIFSGVRLDFFVGSTKNSALQICQEIIQFASKQFKSWSK